MPRHTIGPWAVDLTDVPDFIAERNIEAPNAFGEGGVGLVIGRVLVCRASEELQGNAKLMVAAPDLLEACKIARITLQAVVVADLMNIAAKLDIKRIAAAIAKAGE